MATVIDTWGAAPVPAGSQMAIAGDELFQGSVSGGCVEADVVAAGLDVLTRQEPQTLTFGVADETAWRAGLACGGKIRVHVAPLEREKSLALFAGIDAANADRRSIVIATRLSDGMQQIFADAGAAPAPVAAAFATGVSQTITTPDGETFVHAITPPPRIAIIGATHIGQHLCDLARAIGYGVVVIDPRSAFTNPARFDPASVATGWPEAELRRLADDAYTAVVAVTHTGQIDDEALGIAIRSPCRYAGALGSRKTHEKRLERLASAGFSETELSRIHAPIGLNIGAKSPGEIAVSILAEIIATFRNAKVS